MFQSCNFGTSECPEVASELTLHIFEFFDLFFKGKEIIMRKYYYWKKQRINNYCFWLAQGLNRLTCDLLYQMRLLIEGLADCATAKQGNLSCEK